MAVDLGFDESGEGDVLLVSMQIGSAKKNKRMKKLWQKELGKARVPYFHSRDFNNYAGGVFRDLSRQKRQQLLDSLAQLTRLRLETGVTATVSKKLFTGMTDREFRSKYATEYSFAVQMLLLCGPLFLEPLGLGLDVNIIIEEGHRNSAQALQILRDFQTSQISSQRTDTERLKIANVGVGSKGDYPILQASDMLAYSEFQKSIRGDMQIYEALHVDGSRYKPEVLECDQCFVHIGVESTREYEALLAQVSGQRRKTGILSAIEQIGINPRGPRRRNPC